jgi:hypothetical protein
MTGGASVSGLGLAAFTQIFDVLPPAAVWFRH